MVSDEASIGKATEVEQVEDSKYESLRFHTLRRQRGPMIENVRT